MELATETERTVTMTSTNLTEISRDFDYIRTQLSDGDSVYDLYYGGKAPLNGGGATDGTRLGRNIGRIWNRVTDGVFYATPETSVAWADLQFYGPFYSRREAAMFLAAMNAPHPRYCPSCGAPVIVGEPPIRPLFNRDGYTPHACA